MEDSVKYILQLKDEMSAHLKNIDVNVQKMNRSMGESRNIVGDLTKRFFAFFAVDRIISFGKEYVHAFDEMRRAKVQLDNALSNRAIGITTDELSEKAEAYSEKWIFTKDQILAAQLELTNFKNVAGSIYDRTGKLAIDIASKTGGDLKQITADIGRGLNSPQLGIRLLRQFGVAFTKQERELLESLQETGQMAKAQEMIFKRLEDTYRGAADAAAATDEGQRMLAQHGFEELKEEVGAIISQIQMDLLPYYKKMVAYIRSDIIPVLKEWMHYGKEIFLWIKDHQMLVKSIAALVISYMSIVKVLELVKLAQVAFNSAAMINPYVAAIAGAIALLTYVKQLREAYDDAAAAKNNLVADASHARYERRFDIIKDQINDVNVLVASYKNLNHEQAVDKALLVEKKKLMDQLTTMNPQSKEARELMAKWSALSQMGSADKKKFFPTAGGKGKVEKVEAIGTGSENVTGQKMTNIYVNITNLVKDFTISKVTNLQESEGRIREIVVKALVTAVNDAQILAGQ